MQQVDERSLAVTREMEVASADVSLVDGVLPTAPTGPSYPIVEPEYDGWTYMIDRTRI
jgi:hypothetical protein